LPDIEIALKMLFLRRRARQPIKQTGKAGKGEAEMWGGIIGLIIQLIAGAVGGNVAGAALKQYDLGTLGNSVAGIVGGGLGAQLIGALIGGTGAAGTGGLDIGSIIGQIASGGVGGGILMVIVGLIKQMIGGSKAA
jgi:hypothetical protein